MTTLRGWLRDFIAHYLGGYRSRYRPVWTCLRLVFGAGLGTLLSFIVFYKVISWGGAWIWFGTTHILGPYDIETWQRISDILVILIGSPSELDGGIVLDAVRLRCWQPYLNIPLQAAYRASLQNQALLRLARIETAMVKPLASSGTRNVSTICTVPFIRALKQIETVLLFSCIAFQLLQYSIR